jgi:hypothetical protein
MLHRAMCPFTYAAGKSGYKVWRCYESYYL